MKILNLFAGIGGNRTLWGNKHEIAAIENNQKIAMIYLKRFPKDNVIVADAYEYLLWNYDKFDFIWASPPCQTHSCVNHFLNAQGLKRYPDMGLWKIIIFLRTFYKKIWIVENVKPYYDFIKPTFIINRHYFWSNIYIQSKGNRYGNISITNAKIKTRRTLKEHIKEMQDYHGIYDVNDRYMLSSCVKPEIGKYILDNIDKRKQISLEVF